MRSVLDGAPMKFKIMYDHLKTIGLEKYLHVYFWNYQWKNELHLDKLDSFIANKSQEQKEVLRKKFQTLNNQLDKTHRQLNDLFNEIKIACVYHPAAMFKEESEGLSSDLLDGSVKVEIKTLNESNDEAERHASMNSGEGHVYHGSVLTEEQKAEVKFAVIKKCLYHLNKAVKQVNSNGKVYLVYDYDFMFRQGSNSYVMAPLKDEEVKNILKSTCNDFSKEYPDVSITVVSMSELKEGVENYIK